MEIGRTGIWFSTNGLDRARLTALAQSVEALGYDVLWYPESRAWECLALGGFLLGRTERLMLGSGIANIYGRDAASARMGHDTLNQLYGGRFILGLGVSHVPLVEGFRGNSYGKPVATMRAYLEAMAAAQLDMPAPQRQVVLAALGPRMLELSAELADGALPYNVTPEHTAQARQILGPDKKLCVEQKICLTKDAAAARAVGAQQMARYGALPNYRNNWLRLGFSEAEIAGNADRFLDAMVVWGTEEQIGDVIQAHYAAGADHVAIQPLGPDGGIDPDYRALAAFAPG
jgi:probable F420-dependent oxidoreductase